MSPVALHPARPKTESGVITGRMVFVALCVFFGIVIAANATMAKLAVATNPGTVVDSSYRAGNAFGKEIAAYRAQVARGWSLEAALDESGGKTTVALLVRDREGLAVDGLEITIRLTRPVAGAGDVTSVARASGRGAYVAEIDAPGRGVFDVELSARRDGALLHKTTNRVMLAGSSPGPAR